MFSAHVSGNKRYRTLLEEIISSGYTEESRLGAAFSKHNIVLSWQPGQLFYRPGISRKLGWVETLQILSGTFSANQLAAAAPGLKYEYTEVQAYGLLLKNQLAAIYNLLTVSPESRRAVAYLGAPGQMGDIEKPCISMLQFQICARHLETSVYVRSWDLVSGFIYDTQTIGAISIAMANALGVQSSTVTAFVGNAHVYFSDITRQHIPTDESKQVPDYYFTLPNFRSWQAVQEWAKTTIDVYATSGIVGFPPGIKRVEGKLFRG